MTSEERIERIENGWLEIQQALKTTIDSQARTNETIGGLVAPVTRYIDAAEARTRRLEENLDGLIRAITAEHSNGKSHQQ
jgi:hypothetical protein